MERKNAKSKALSFLKKFGVIIVFTVVVVYCASVLIIQQNKIKSTEAANAELSKKFETMENEYAALENELETAGSDSYAENTAREKLGWVKQGETVFRNASGEEN